MDLLSKVDFSFQNLLFVTLGLLVGVVIGVYFIYNSDDENEIFGLIKKDCKTIRQELEKVKVDISNDEHIKQKAIAYSVFLLKYINKYFGLSNDALWDKYQCHKESEALKIASAMQTHDELIKSKK